MKFNLKINKLNKTYNVLVVDDENKINYMIKKYKDFNSKYMGIDFEFKKITKNTRDIALVQVNLENDENEAYLFIFYPPMLNDNQLNIFINLLVNEDIIKIIHGGESLDIPYIFNNLLKNNDKLIIKFLTNLYDTKFLCEYHHLIKNKNLKCKIYEILFEMKLLDQKDLDMLNNVELEIGPIYNVTFDIKNLNDNLIKYALYDVLYLPSLFKKFKNYQSIKDLTSICYYYKRNSDKLNELNKELNELNNSIIVINDYKIKLIEIFYYFYYYKLNDEKIIEYSKITYFKEFIIIIIKYLVYNLIIKDKFNINKITFYDKINKLIGSLNNSIKQELYLSRY